MRVSACSKKLTQLALDTFPLYRRLAANKYEIPIQTHVLFFIRKNAEPNVKNPQKPDQIKSF